MDEEESSRLRSCITAMQETLAATDDPDISLDIGLLQRNI